MNFNFDLSSNLNYNSSSYFSNFGLNSLPPDIQAQEKEDLFLSDDEENDPKPRLPLFGRCPTTGRAYLDVTPPNRKLPLRSASSPYSPAKSPAKSPYSPYSLYSPSKSLYSPSKSSLSPYYRGEERFTSQEAGGDIFGRNRLLMEVSSRMPLLQIANNRQHYDMRISPKKVSWSQVARKTSSMEGDQMRTPPGFPAQSPMQHVRSVSTNLFPCPPASPETPESRKKAAANLLQVKPSLDEVQDDSLVAMTNKHGKGKYWFKSGCPTPDPRWPARQQLMIGPIPGDVEYATLRSAFLSKGHTIHLFIQNNQAWLEKNQEKFGKKQVKFGYVVYTEPEVARRLLAQAHVLVGHARVAVKEMDGQPALFN